MYKCFSKRIFDFTVALVGLLILFPVLVILCVLLFLINQGSPFFFQDRPGWKERRIRIVKFKTMTDERDSMGNLLPDNQRMTKLGGVIRKTSLDELPQLWNVLTGDMSLIGPRPLLFKYLPLYSSEQRRRHEVRPGITGWAQVNGRNSISWKRKFELDVFYVNHVSFRLDLKILWLTVLKVMKREGVNQSSDRPMQPFKGNQEV